MPLINDEHLKLERGDCQNEFPALWTDLYFFLGYNVE